MPSGIYERTKKIRQGMSKSQIKRFASEKERQKISEALEEYWAKMGKEERIERSKHWIQAGHKASSSRKGIILSPRIRQNISKGVLKRWAKMTREERIEYCKPMIEAGRNSHTLESIQKQAQTLKEYWSEIPKEERVEYMLKATRASQKANPSSIEKAIWKELDKLSIEYKTQISFNNGKFIVDIYVPAQKLIIECNGDYWHNLPCKKERDKKLKEYAKNNDYGLVELWEHDIRKNSKQALLKALLGVKSL